MVKIFISSDLWLRSPWSLHLAGLANGKKDNERRENIKMKNSGRREEIKAGDIFSGRKEAESGHLFYALFVRDI